MSRIHIRPDDARERLGGRPDEFCAGRVRPSAGRSGERGSGSRSQSRAVRRGAAATHTRNGRSEYRETQEKPSTSHAGHGQRENSLPAGK